MHEPKRVDGVSPLWTIETVAREIVINRSRLTEIFNNKPHRGGKSRPRIVAFFKRQFPKTWPAILETLGWDERGNLLTGPTRRRIDVARKIRRTRKLHVQHST
ncbi:MAG TPA: hypothetical protein VH413_16400 [Verrucomicrobiae bacterium]|nr:hypothetical protein [Verrucomicrobiae bacterium]